MVRSIDLKKVCGWGFNSQAISAQNGGRVGKTFYWSISILFNILTKQSQQKSHNTSRIKEHPSGVEGG